MKLPKISSLDMKADFMYVLCKNPKCKSFFEEKREDFHCDSICKTSKIYMLCTNCYKPFEIERGYSQMMRIDHHVCEDGRRPMFFKKSNYQLFGGFKK